MKKDFDSWNEKKKEINKKTPNEILFFKEGEIWWIHFGVNVGFEMDGKGEGAMRPVLILKKYNHFSFLAIPLSTSPKINKYHVSIGKVSGKSAVVNLSQLKNVDSRRLINKIGVMDKEVLKNIKEKTSRVNLG